MDIGNAQAITARQSSRTPILAGADFVMIIGGLAGISFDITTAEDPSVKVDNVEFNLPTGVKSGRAGIAQVHQTIPLTIMERNGDKHKLVLEEVLGGIVAGATGVKANGNLVVTLYKGVNLKEMTASAVITDAYLTKDSGDALDTSNSTGAFTMAYTLNGTYAVDLTRPLRAVSHDLSNSQLF